MITLEIYTNRDDDDFYLGRAYLEFPPPIGSFMRWLHPFGAFWRVISCMVIVPKNDLTMIEMTRQGPGWTPLWVFVEPAERPFGP